MKDTAKPTIPPEIQISLRDKTYYGILPIVFSYFDNRYFLHASQMENYIAIVNENPKNKLDEPR